jgi:transcription antitermination factor NusG
MNTDRSYAGEFRSGDRVKVIDGTFVGYEGCVSDAKEVRERWERCGGTEPPRHMPPGCIWVVLTIFSRPVPVMLDRFQVEHIAK